MAVDETYNLGDTLHRLMKQSLDSGMCKSIAEAEGLFRRYRIHIEISAADAASPQHQAALLTVIALARRVFLGGVTCDDTGDANLMLAMPLGGTVKDAVVALGGLITPTDSSTPTISIGDYIWPVTAGHST